METWLAVLVFCSALGILLFLYAINFRRRALILGTKSLRAALSRSICGEETCPPEELERGARELDSRFRKAVILFWTLLSLDLVICILLTVLSVLPELALALCGPAVLFLSAALSSNLLRELPRLILAEEEREGN